MSNIVISPESGILEFNYNLPSGAAIRSATAPIRLDATGGNSFVTGAKFGIGTNSPNSTLLVHGHTIAISTTGLVGKGLHLGESFDHLGLFGSSDVGTHYNPDKITLSAGNRNEGNSAYIDIFSRFGDTASSFGDIDLRAGYESVHHGFYGDINLLTSGLNRVTVKSDGKVGIGSASPDHKLRVADGNICIDSDQAFIGNIYRSFVASNTNIRLNNTTDMQFNLHNTNMDFKFGLQGSDPFFTIGGDGVVTSTGAHISGISGIFSDSTVTPKITTAAGNLNITPAGSYIFIGKGLYGSNVGVGYQNSAVSALKFFLGASIDAPDIKLERDGAGQLALRNGSNAQNLRIYNTYTSATNFERGSLRWENDVFTIAAEAGSAGGTSRNLSISGGATVGITTSDTERITVLANGLVGINDTSPASYRLCVGGGIHATATSKFDGVITLNDVRVEDQIRHDGDTDTRIAFSDDAISIHAGGIQMINFSESTTDQVIVNGGNNDVDFKVMSNLGAEAFKVQGSDGFVGVGIGSPTSALHAKLAEDVSMNNSATGHFTIEGAGGFKFGISLDDSAANIYHTSASRDLILGTNETARIRISGNGGIVINEGGADADLRIAGASEANLLYIDAGQGKVGIGTNAPTKPLEVNGAALVNSLHVKDSIIHDGDTDTKIDFAADTITLDAGGEEHIKLEVGGVTINEGGEANDLRVEGDTDTHLLHVDGSSNRVGIGVANPSSFGMKLEVGGGVKIDDVNFFTNYAAGLAIQCESSNDPQVIVAAQSAVQNNNSKTIFRVTDNTYNTPFFQVNGGGNVAIGTNVPTTKLDVRGNISGSGNFIGTGVGNRITASDGTPYLVSGDVSSAGETDTLQTVTTRGNSTSTSILSTGPHISGVTGLFEKQVGIGTSSPNSDLHVYAPSSAPTFRISRGSNGQVWTQTIDSSARFLLQEAASEGGTLNTRLSIDDAGETLLCMNGGSAGIGTVSVNQNGSKTTLDIHHATAGAAIRLRQASNRPLTFWTVYL